MFDQEIETIIRTARDRVPHSIADTNTIVIKDILAADIPYAIKTFFRCDTELLLAEELKKHRKESRFNYDSPEVQGMQREINSLLVMNFSIPRNEFQRRLEDSVHLLVNYFVRPQWTITNVIFEKEREISVSSILRLLRYFGSYEYLRSLILRYVEEKQIRMLTRESFSSLVRKLDGEFFRRKTGDEISRIMLPLFEFLEYPRRSGDNALPVKGLVKFFEDKGILSVAARLNQSASDGISELRASQLGDILEELRRTSGAFEITMPAMQAAPEEPMGNIVSTPEPVRVQEPPPDPPPQPKIEFRFEPKTITFTPEPPPPTAVPDPIPRETAIAKSAPPEPIAPRDVPLSVAQELPPPTPERAVFSALPPVLLNMSDSDKKKFIKKIFQQDEQAFLKALHSIDSFNSWRQASVFIDEIFIANDVDPYSSEAIRFIDVIEEKFYPKK